MMCMMDEIHAKRDEIYAIARKHKAEKLWVFGSCARKEERPDSDVDFLVKFSDGAEFGSQVALGDDFICLTVGSMVISQPLSNAGWK